METQTPYTSALSPEYALLGCLALGSAHGYELHRRLAADLGQVWHLSQSQTYNILARLETQGLISSSLVAQSRLPARRILELTPAGHERFAAWLAAPTGCSVRAIRVEFITRLYFAQRLQPERVASMIAAQEAETRAGLARLQASLAATPADRIFNRLGLELRIRQLASVLDWLGECADLLHPDP